MAEQRFHEKHFPTFLRIPQVFTRPLHWSAHVAMLTTVAFLVVFGTLQTLALVSLRHAVAQREADVLVTVPFSSVSQPSLLGDTIICEPALLRWYFGTGPLCDAGFGPDTKVPTPDPSIVAPGQK
ncbi:MAG: hypothetical protein RLZZ324_1080 [Candidatus Parcubacteria bacterium]|jgi:hypothetical protein